MFRLLIALSIIMCGCEQIEIKETVETANGSNRSSRSIDSFELADNIQIDIKGGDPEKYVVHFSWPNFKNENVLRIRMNTVLTEVKSSQTFFTQIMNHDTIATFSFDVLDNNRNIINSFYKTVATKKDIVFRANNHLIDKDTTIDANRIYISREFPLTTMGNNVSLIADEIHILETDGFVQTYPLLEVFDESGKRSKVVQNAMPLTNGKDGGNLSISANKLFGRLDVYMRGEKGGKGKTGAKTPGRALGEGKEAPYGELACDNFGCGSNPNICSEQGNPRKLFSMDKSCSCKSFGKPGGEGPKGNPGGKGLKGMPGGSSGNLHINIHQFVRLTDTDPSLPRDNGRFVRTYTEPGPGGDGGDGGEGQNGGEGGKGRNSSDPLDCRGKKGEDGRIGDRGPTGEPGARGGEGSVCIHIGSENINECSK